jgi:hypothetical protein
VKLFGVDIAKELNKALGKGLLPCTYVSLAQGSRTSGQLTSGKGTTPTTYSCRGFFDDYEEKRDDDATTTVSYRTIGILGDTLPVEPALGDTATLEGRTYQVVESSRDPARGLWLLKCR